jgi:hypothetical protein
MKIFSFVNWYKRLLVKGTDKYAMATSIAKLRQEYKKDTILVKKMIDECDDSIRRKKTDVHIRTEQPVCSSMKKKLMTIDPVKLEFTIKKACIPVEKKNIVVLETLPKKVVAVVPVPVPIAICQAKNLNGTPCKCKAKVGKFCTKHSG